MKILIPTCKTQDQIKGYVEKVSAFSPGCSVYASCQDGSASVNRNWCLEKSGIQIGEVGIMIDDDLDGFYFGWVEDLAYPFREDFPIKNIAAVSARLMRPDGRLGETCTRCFDLTPEEIQVKAEGSCTIPTAAISFRHLGVFFSTELVGSGYDDNWWCLETLEKFPEAVYVQSNRCKLVHENHMFRQKGKFWDHNLAAFTKRWGKR